jgi:hypothetical protein
MKNYNETKLEAEITELLMNRENFWIEKINNSTGCLWTKEGLIINIINKIFKDFLVTNIMDIIDRNIDDLSVTDADGLYSMEEIQEAFDRMNFSQFVTIDNDSAEFQLSYTNQVELIDVEYEVDENELIEQLDIELNRAKRNTNNQ